MGIQTGEKIRVSLRLSGAIGAAPIHLGQRRQSRIHLGLHKFLGRMFRPHVALSSENASRAMREGVGQRIEAVSLFQVRAAQGVVQIAMARGRYNHIGPQVHRLRSAPHTTPTLHRSALWQASFENLIPTDDRFAFGSQVLAHALDEPTLQLLLILQAFLGHPALAFFARRPTDLGGFIASDVNPWAGKQFHHLIQNSLQESKSAVVARAIDVLENAPTCGNFQGQSSAPQFRVRRQGCRTVSGHLYLGNHLDVTGSCIGHHLSNLLLRIIPPVARAICFLPPCAH